MTVRNGTAATAGSFAADRGPIDVLAHDLRADQSNPEITVWCPKCEERVVALRNGTCGWCNTKLDLEQPTPDPAAAVPPRTPAARHAVETREEVEVTLWRRTEIFEWLIAEGPKTIVEIKDHFDITQNTAAADVAALRVEGRLERTGVERQGPRGGRPSTEYRARDPHADSDLTSHARTGDAEAEQPAAPAEEFPGSPEASHRDAADTDRTIEEGQHDEQGEPATVGREVAAPITLHEQLVVHYISALIGWVERSAFVRDQGPPDHVFDRIERLLQIEEGAA